MNDHNDIQKIVGARIRELRKLRGMTQENFGFDCNLDRTYISGIERGTRNVSLKNLYTIASKLSVPLSMLFSDVRTRAAADADDQDAYIVNPDFNITPGFTVTTKDVTNAALAVAIRLEDLPFGLFTSIDLKALSGIVGALFAACLAENVGAIVNPIEKGHPDVIPAKGKNASEALLRNYPEGLEIKCTVGNVAKGSGLNSGDERISNLTGITWQAHHQEVKSLMGLVVDFSGSNTGRARYPIITGVFYANSLSRNDWGKISGIKGRNTKVTGMLTSGKKKMGAGWIIVSNRSDYITKYGNILSFTTT